MNWWHPNYNYLMTQIPSSIHKILKQRIETSKIREKKCELGEECFELQDLFEKQVDLYKQRKIVYLQDANILKEIKLSQEKEFAEKRQSLILENEQLHKQIIEITNKFNQIEKEYENQHANFTTR